MVCLQPGHSLALLLPQDLFLLFSRKTSPPDLLCFEFLLALLHFRLAWLRREGIIRLVFGLFCFSRRRLEGCLLLRLTDDAVGDAALDLVSVGGGRIARAIVRTVVPAEVQPARSKPVEDHAKERHRQDDNDDDRQAVDPPNAGWSLAVRCAAEIEGLNHVILPHPRRMNDKALAGVAPVAVTV